MMQFYASKDAAKDLAAHIQPSLPEKSAAMQWYLHRVTVARRKCIFAMELHSRYVMAFCGLTKKEFDNFPIIFAERFWREAMVLVNMEHQLTETQEAVLATLAQEIGRKQSYQLGSDRSVTAHITAAVELLRILVEYQGYPLPVDDPDAVSFGVQVNNHIRSYKGRSGWFYPHQEYRSFWLGLLQHLTSQATPARFGSRKLVADTVVDKPADNIINIDFLAPKK